MLTTCVTCLIDSYTDGCTSSMHPFSPSFDHLQSLRMYYKAIKTKGMGLAMRRTHKGSHEFPISKKKEHIQLMHFNHKVQHARRDSAFEEFLLTFE